MNADTTTQRPTPEHERQQALSAIAQALDTDEQARIIHHTAAAGSSLDGAEVTDILDIADDHDTYVAKIDPFLDASSASLPHIPGLRIAALAICLQRQSLTATAVLDLLARAGLLLLNWTALRPGWQADGTDHRYLVTRTPDRRVLVTRWDRHADPASLDTIREAVHAVLHVSGPYEGRQIAERFERGESIPGHPAWQH